MHGTTVQSLSLQQDLLLATCQDGSLLLLSSSSFLPLSFLPPRSILHAELLAPEEAPDPSHVFALLHQQAATHQSLLLAQIRFGCFAILDEEYHEESFLLLSRRHILSLHHHLKTPPEQSSLTFAVFQMHVATTHHHLQRLLNAHAFADAYAFAAQNQIDPSVVFHRHVLFLMSAWKSSQSEKTDQTDQSEKNSQNSQSDQNSQSSQSTHNTQSAKNAWAMAPCADCSALFAVLAEAPSSLFAFALTRDALPSRATVAALLSFCLAQLQTRHETDPAVTLLALKWRLYSLLLARGLPATAGTWLVDARCRDDA